MIKSPWRSVRERPPRCILNLMTPTVAPKRAPASAIVRPIWGQIWGQLGSGPAGSCTALAGAPPLAGLPFPCQLLNALSAVFVTQPRLALARRPLSGAVHHGISALATDLIACHEH